MYIPLPSNADEPEKELYQAADLVWLVSPASATVWYPRAVREMSADELFTHLREGVAILAASAKEQVEWLTQGVPAPVDELMLQYYEMVPSWFPLLRNRGVIDAECEAALAVIRNEFEMMVKGRNHNLWENDDALYLYPEWEHIRKLSRMALLKIDELHGKSSANP